VQAGGDGIGVLSVQSSYPAGIAGEMVDRFARAISVIDAYSATTLDRPTIARSPRWTRCASSNAAPARSSTR
jgi:hypothetical protein